jgi:hypothetical protein
MVGVLGVVVVWCRSEFIRHDDGYIYFAFEPNLFLVCFNITVGWHGRTKSYPYEFSCNRTTDHFASTPGRVILETLYILFLVWVTKLPRRNLVTTAICDKRM